MESSPCGTCGGTDRNPSGRCRACMNAAVRRYKARQRLADSHKRVKAAAPAAANGRGTGHCHQCGAVSSSWFCGPACFDAFTMDTAARMVEARHKASSMPGRRGGLVLLRRKP